MNKSFLNIWWKPVRVGLLAPTIILTWMISGALKPPLLRPFIYKRRSGRALLPLFMILDKGTLGIFLLCLLSEFLICSLTITLVSDIPIWGPAENGILSLKEAYNFYRVPIKSVCGLPSYGPKWFFLGCIWVGVWLNYY